MGRMAATVVLALVLACSPSPDESAPSLEVSEVPIPNEVVLMVEPLAEVYPTEGPLEVEVTIRNETDTEFFFRPILNFGAFLDADIVDSAGELLTRRMELDPPNAAEVRLDAGESHVDTVNIRCSIMVVELGECLQMYDLSEPGTYEVRMRFSAPCDSPHCTEAHDRMKAQPFRIEIRG